jgi:aryl-alcohol dehydrogenase-like predicted oxidoreductase
MRQVRAAPLGRDVSALGFGCASLGSRVSAGQGARAIAQALDLGVTWFDVAPPYGDGMAEAHLGRCLLGRRENVVICTKFGIARPQISLPQRLLRPIARRAVAAFPGLRSRARRARPIAGSSSFDPSAIEESVTESLRQLQTDYIDVLALHEPTPQQAADPRVFEVLERLRERGLLRAVGIAGAPESIETAVAAGRCVDVAQFPNPLFSNAAARLRSRLPTPRAMFVTHGVFGDAEGVLRGTPELGAALAAAAERHGLESSKAIPTVLSAFAFSSNPDGVVIASMFTPAHLESNCAAAGRTAPAGFAEEVAGIVARHQARAA